MIHVLWRGGQKGVLGFKPLRNLRNAGFYGRSGVDRSLGKEGTTKEVVSEEGAMCPLLPQKERWRGEPCIMRKRKEVKIIPGSSLIDAPDVAGVHQDKETK